MRIMKPPSGLALFIVSIVSFVPLCKSFDASIAQGNPFVGQSNEITVYVFLDRISEFAQNQALTLSGLKYNDVAFDTPGPLLQLYSIDGGMGGELFFGNIATWVPSAGNLTLAVNLSAPIVPGATGLFYGFKFILKNPTTATKTIPYSSDYPLLGRLFLMGIPISTDGSPGPFNLAGEKVPLTIIDPVMSIVSVQSTPLACASNSVSLTLTMMITCTTGSNHNPERAQKYKIDQPDVLSQRKLSTAVRILRPAQWDRRVDRWRGCVA
jgi:hypothetical protein